MEETLYPHHGVTIRECNGNQWIQLLETPHGFICIKGVAENLDYFLRPKEPLRLWIIPLDSPVSQSADAEESQPAKESANGKE